MAELGDFLVSSEDALKNVEADHLDFSYVEACEDVEMMRGIVTVLRSGKEGHYPELLEKAEAKLMTLLPAAERERTLRLRQAATAKDISIAENELLQWEQQVAQTDKNLRDQDALRKMALDDDVGDIAVPKDSAPERKSYPVRGSAPAVKPPAPPATKNGGMLNEIDTSKRSANEDEATRKARIARKQRRETEHNRLVNNRKSVTTGKVNKQSTNENTSVTYIAESSMFSDYEYLESLPALERSLRGEREKTKGNEHFKAGEHVDAFLCYTRSIILDDANPAAYSNRAIVNLKLNKLELAESDCNSALSLEGHEVSYEKEAATDKKKADKGVTKAKPLPKSAVKMVSRRGMARFRLGKYKDAIEDFYAALLATTASAGDAGASATTELEQLLKKAQDKYEEVEGRAYVLIRDRSKLSAAEARAASKADVKNSIDVTVNRMAPSSSFLFTFDGEDRDCRKAAPKVERGFAGALETKPKAPKVYDWVVATEGVLTPATVQAGAAGQDGLGSPGGHFTRISISMSDDEDTEDEDVDADGGATGGFSRITITESDTEEEDGGAGGGTRIAIEEDSESEEEPGPAAPTDAEFLTFKEEGNRCMKAKQYAQAIEAYSKCIQTDPVRMSWNSHPSFVASLNNRAAVYLELKEFSKCYADCTTVLQHEPSNVKAFYRRATAYEKNSQLSSGIGVAEKVNLLELGLKDAASVLSIERSNKQATTLHQRLVTLVAEARSARDADADALERESEEQAAVRENVADAPEPSAAAVAVAWVYEVEMKKQQVKSLLSGGCANLSGGARDKNLQEAAVILSGCLDTVKANKPTAANNLEVVELELSLCHLLITTYRSLGKRDADIVATCGRAIELDARNVKAYLRRAQANVALNKKKEANVDLKRILKLDPYNNEVLGLLDELSGDTESNAFNTTAAAAVPSAGSPSKKLEKVTSLTKAETPVASPTKAETTTPAQVFSPPVTTTPMTPLPTTPAAAAVTPASGAAASALLSPGTPGVSSSAECLRLKDLGNQATTAKKYQEAIKLYSSSIDADSSHLPSWSNRSQAYLKLSLWDNVVDDCTHVMKALPVDKQLRSASENSLMVKVCYRRAIAYKGKYVPKMVYTSQFLPMAMQDVELLLQLDPTNKPALQEKASLTALIASSNAIAEKNHPTYAAKGDATASTKPSDAVEGLSARSTTVRKASAPSTPMADTGASTSTSASSSKKKKKDKDVPVVSNTEAALKAAAAAADVKLSSVPNEAPVTVVEFERHWKLLRSKPDLFVHQYLLKVFKKSTYKKVIKTSISDELLSYVYKNTYEQCVLLAPESTTLELSNSAYSILKGMTANTDNFAMIVSVLSSQDLEYISNVITELEGHVARGADGITYSNANIASLKASYNIQ